MVKEGRQRICWRGEEGRIEGVYQTVLTEERRLAIPLRNSEFTGGERHVPRYSTDAGKMREKTVLYGWILDTKKKKDDYDSSSITICI